MKKCRICRVIVIIGAAIILYLVTGCATVREGMIAANYYSQLYCADENLLFRQLLVARAREVDPNWIPVCDFNGE